MTWISLFLLSKKISKKMKKIIKRKGIESWDCIVWGNSCIHYVTKNTTETQKSLCCENL